ncbi:MAG: RidA family protein [Sphingorhabdus sp.]|uniref:RidA family protein n=1 Tax=Sphingorhabdus sp. TaxID=1902408 RepID=UPI003C8C8751
MYDRRDAIMLLSSALYIPMGAKASEMKIKPIQAEQTSYAQAVEIVGPNRLLFISGQVPADADGIVPAAFPEQAKLVWRNIIAQLARAEMTIENLAKLTIYLSDRSYREQNTQVRHAVLGGHSPALTVIIADIFDEAWLLEIEAVAVA